MRAALAFLVLGVACGGGRATPRAPAFPTGALVRITDGGQIYDALNTVDCVKWPSPAVKKRAGRDGWGGFDPGTGLEGKVVASVRHCEDPIHVVLVEVGDYVVPVTQRGVEKIDAKQVVDPLGAGLAGSAFGGDVYGLFGGDIYGGLLGGEAPPEEWWDDGSGGGVVGGVVGGGVVGGAMSYYPGAVVEIVDDGEVFSTINEIDCLTWPSDDVKQKGGAKAWGSFQPKNGDTGTILATSLHCNDQSEVLIVEIGGHVVPIRARGVAVY